MGLSASQGRLLLLTARRSDLEYRAQQISQKRLILSQQLEEISLEYENATSNRQMKINLYGTDKDENGNAINRTMNLTYAALISGIYQHGEELTGIKKSSAVQSNGWTSNNAYRLVSVDGAIVVSSKDEIPTVHKSVSTDSFSSVSDENKLENYENIYKVTKTGRKDDGTDGDIIDHLAIDLENLRWADESQTKQTELYSMLNGNDSLKGVKFNAAEGIVKIGDGAEAKFYDIKTGALKTDATAGLEYENAALYAKASLIPNSTRTNDESYEYGENLVQGNDGCYTLYDKKGNIINRYVVDENLRLGMTDSAGTYDGPNYLQDCLRNGKYLLEQGKADNNTDEGFRWSSVSWDTTSNISDSYYTEDDDAAKAKYDRLQTQIQAQDKKLEIELDNIETQRSAVTTEVESVEKVINEDIEGTFNAFG